MKRSTCQFILMATAVVWLAGVAIPAHAITINNWSFEVNTPADLNNSTTISGILDDSGKPSASGVHASAATDWSTPAGNGSANSLSVNTWAVGDYFQFQVSTINFHNIALSWDQVSSAQGPGTFGLFWSLTGLSGSFTQFGVDYTVPQPTTGVWGSYSFNLSSILTLNNASAAYFRLVDQSSVRADGTAGGVAASGTDRVDNFNVSGVVPDPGSSAILLSIPLLGLLTLRRFTMRRAKQS